MDNWPVCSAPAMTIGWSVVTFVIVMVALLVRTLATVSSTALTVDGVNVSGTPSSEPVSLVA